MTVRRLSRDEWTSALGDVALAQLLPLVGDDAVVFAVEDNGRLVACWSLVKMWHAEGLWIAPEHRSRIAVARHLLREMKMAAKEMDAPVILTGTETNDFVTQRLLDHVGAEPLPMTVYRWPILEEVN